MEKHKADLRIIVAVVLVLVMAALPILTAFWQDRATLGTPSLGQLQTVELDFEKGLPGLGLLALMQPRTDNSWQVIDVSVAAMSMEEVEEAAWNALKLYQDAGLIDAALPFEIYSAEARATSGPGGLAAIFWDIVLMAKTKDTFIAEVSLLLDDTTGRVVHINYGGETQIPEEEMYQLLSTFADVFFTELEIEDYALAEDTYLENTYIGDSAVAKLYRFGDSTYGEVHVDLCVFRSGFYSSFYDW